MTLWLKKGVWAVLAGVFVTSSAFAKNERLTLSPMRKAALLNFPPLPRALQDRIAGRPAAVAATPSKLDSALSRDWALSKIGFFEVFTPLVQPVKRETQPCSPNIIVAVVDTGIDYTHPELMDNVWVNPGESGPWAPAAHLMAQTQCRDKSCNGIDDDKNGYADDVVGWDFVNEVPLPFDMHGHGTHIAGIIGSNPANGTGIVGVCPRVAIMALKYYDNSGAANNNLQNTVRAIQYAVKNGADIINYSGGGADPAPAERASIEEARNQGVLFVAAAGNDGHNNDQIPYFPASYPLDNIISVASVNKDDQLLPSSNYGKTVHVAAPGLSILSPLPGGRYGTMSGTSQATAFVTGAAALLASQWKSKSEFDYRKLKTWITTGVRPMPGNTGNRLMSGGLLSVVKSLQVQKDALQNGPTPGPRQQEIAQRPSKKPDLLR